MKTFRSQRVNVTTAGAFAADVWSREASKEWTVVVVEFEERALASVDPSHSIWLLASGISCFLHFDDSRWTKSLQLLFDIDR